MNSLLAREIINKVSSSRRHGIILMLGFSSGLPAALTAGTLQAWFTDAGLSLYAIGALTLLVLPYSLRFLWSSFFDQISPPFLDRRRGWLLLSQLGLVLSLTLMACLTPDLRFTLGSWSVPWLLIFGLLTAFLSSSQDTVVNAYQIEILPKVEKGLGAAIYVTGWRLGNILSGALGLVLASQVGWQQTYLLMASMMIVGMIATLLAPTPETTPTQVGHSFLELTLSPIKEFFDRFGWKTAGMLLLLIATYKLGEALALALNTTFLLREIGFDKTTLGLINKTVSIIAALLGGIIAGFCMPRLTLYRGLWVFGSIQGLANLSYALLMYAGKSIPLLVLAAFTENFCSGLGTIALLTLIMSLCNIKFTAAQFALLSAVAFLPRTIVGPLAAWMVSSIGWLHFFVGCFILSLPTLGLIFIERTKIKSL